MGCQLPGAPPSPWSPPGACARLPAVFLKVGAGEEAGALKGDLPAQASARFPLDHPPTSCFQNPSGQLRSLGRGGGRVKPCWAETALRPGLAPDSPGLCCRAETLTSASVPGSLRVPSAQGRGCTGFKTSGPCGSPAVAPPPTPPPQVTAPQPYRQRQRPPGFRQAPGQPLHPDHSLDRHQA